MHAEYTRFRPALPGISLTILTLLFYWLDLFKLVHRLLRRLGRVGPCPFRFSWLLDVRPSRWYRNAVLDWIGLQPGTTVLEMGPGTTTRPLPPQSLATPSDQKKSQKGLDAACFVLYILYRQKQEKRIGQPDTRHRRIHPALG